jgi:Spy/CpxP family protein refolding chaperone
MFKQNFYRNLIFGAVLLTLFWCAPALNKAQDDQPKDNPQDTQKKVPLWEQLNLTEEQKTQIRQIIRDSRPRMVEAQARQRQALVALDEAIYADDSTEDLVKQRARELQQAQNAVVELRTRTEYSIRKLLTPEQLRIFRQLRLRQTLLKRQQNQMKRQENLRQPNNQNRSLQRRNFPMRRPNL